MSAEHLQPDAPKHKILIVDDIPKNLQVLGNILDNEDVDISFATNGSQAIELAHYNLPDLILLDISMPEMNGYEVCSKLKENENTKNIPVIFLTARTESESIVKGLQAGGEDYITKPFNSEELIARVKIHLELKDKREAIEKQAISLSEMNNQLIKLNSNLKVQKNTIYLKNKYLTDSINYAQIIQNSLLSSIEKLKSFFTDSFIYYNPKDIISGDFYFFEKVENKIIIIVSDCTGHGVPGALLTMLGITLLKQMIVYEKIREPTEILKRLDNEVVNMLTNTESKEKTGDGMDMAVCSIDIAKQELIYSGCKMPLYLIRNKNLIKYKGSVHSIGGIYDIDNKEIYKQVIALENNDIIYLCSDGYESQFGGEQNKKFSRKQFRRLLAENHESDMQEQKSTLHNTLIEWMGSSEQVDDILVLGFKYKWEF